MDAADKFINNKAPKKLFVYYIVFFALLCIISFCISLKCAEKITVIHIQELIDIDEAYRHDTGCEESPGNLNGISINSVPESFDIYHSTLKTLLMVTVSLSFAVCTIWYILATRSVFSIYTELENLTDEIEEIKENGGPLKHSFGVELDCIRRTSDAVSGIGERMSYLTEKLTAERDFLKEFLSDFSHQLKTSLAVIRLDNDMLDSMDNLTEEKAIALSNEINESCDDMESLIFSALKLAKLNAGAIVCEISKGNLSDLCKKAVSKVRPLLDKKNITVLCDCDKDVIWDFDSIWLCEAVVNLIKNSADHSKCSEIKISLSETAVSAVITIHDNGVGIPQASIPGLFKRFGKISRESGMNSVGIGMSISEKIIRIHNGEILVYSTEGIETTFEIVLLKSTK